MIRLPGLIDPHVHVREPGQTHKEDWDTATQAALAGGVTMILAMPNTKPPIFDAPTLKLALDAARQKARCDYAQFVGAGPENAEQLPALVSQSAGLKMYLDSTFGELRLDDMTLWMPHFANYPKEYPIVLHSESRTMAAGILFAAIYDRPVHIAHVSLKEEILLIKAAKERRLKVTCEVCPHHLFLTEDDIPSISHGHPGRGEVRPRLATNEDVEALWQNMEVIDCFATDHAPHTLAEKDSENPPPGFPGLETLLPLLLTAVDNGRHRAQRVLTIDDIVQKSVVNPRKIFHLPEQPETWIEVDEHTEYEIRAQDQFTRCGWTPFEGWRVKGKVTKVVLRGKTAFEDGKILAESGYGENIRK
ncbi:MAG TPA: amidohydrolase family protein [Anaerolineales bacterium]|nr:amidohydrolase family protein [Anaerolineales bacterium]